MESKKLSAEELSIIIPVYNSEKYLSQCLDSILKQEDFMYEIILIDDGSTDSSLEIMREYARSHKKIKTVTQSNRGVSAARNIGIDMALGDYIAFVDSDDCLYPDSLGTRMSDAQKCDLLISSYVLIDEEGNEDISFVSPKSETPVWSKDELYIELFQNVKLGYQGYIWNKVFKTEIIKNHQIRFDESILYNEDRLFVLQYLAYCKSVSFSNSVVYQYRKNPVGAMSKLNKIDDTVFSRIKTEFDAFEKMRTLLEKENIDAYYLCCIQEFYQYLIIFRRASLNALKIRGCARSRAIKFIPNLWKIPNRVFPISKKIKALGHVILMR